MLLVLIGCGIMAWMEGALRPVYPVKSALKIAVFLGCAGLYTLLSGDRRPFRVLRKAVAVRLAVPLALGVLVFLLGGYVLLSPWLDLSAIPENLAAKGVKVYKTFVGEYMTSIEMAGFSISLLKLDDQLKGLLDAKADTPGFKA